MLLFMTGFILYWIAGIIIISLLAKLDTIDLTLNDVQNEKGKVLICVGVWWIVLIAVVCKRIPLACSTIMSFVMKKIFRIPEQTNETPVSTDPNDYRIAVGTPFSSGATISSSTVKQKTKKEKVKKPVKKDGADRFKLMDL